MDNPTAAQTPIEDSTATAHRSPNLKVVVIVLVILLLGVSTALAYVISHKSTPKNPMVTAVPLPTAFDVVATPDPTSNWKTYSNATYGYSLRVPSFMTQQQDNRSGVLSINDADWRFAKTDVTSLDSSHKALTTTAISLEVSSFPENVSEGNYDETCRPELLGFNIQKPEVAKVSKIVGASKYLEYSGKSAYDTQQDVPWWSANVCFMYNNHFYHLNYQNFESTIRDPNFDVILSTFTFTK